MSDAIKHECGIALVRLKKSFSPSEFGVKTFGTWTKSSGVAGGRPHSNW